MPSQTFHKLPDSKRKKFLKESYKEFALHSLEAASITNLVKSLGIAKGSVYQYFDNKEALYRFLVIDANKQLVLLLNKACVYSGEPFFDWYTKLILVELKFYMSFPHFALLFRNLFVELGMSQKELAQEIEDDWLSRISANLPSQFYNSAINNKILTSSPLLIFNLITNKLNLNQLIIDEEIVSLDTKDLVSLCTEWVMKLKEGL